MVVGARQIGDFLARSIFTMGPVRLVEAHSNASPAFAMYLEGPPHRLALFALLVLATDGQHITRMDAFADPRAISRFDLPTELAG
jgi:hypothetical protein